MNASSRLRLPTLLLAVLPALSLAADNMTLWVVGSAYDAAGASLLYRELHFCDPAAVNCLVEYREPGGDLIARKELDYRDSPHAPALVMQDLRAGTGRRLDVPEDEKLVVDAGFDNFVRSRWPELAGGRAVEFEFLPVALGRPVRMNAARDADAKCAASELCLTVQVDSWLLGLLAQPIHLTYSQDDRRLQRFRGVSNLRGAGGDSFEVDIRYSYSGDTVAAAAGQFGESRSCGEEHQLLTC